MLLAVAEAPVLGVTLADNVGATKPEKNTIASVKNRIQAQRDHCELLGNGELQVNRATGGKTWFTEYEGGEYDGTSCRHSEQSTNCTCDHTGKKGMCEQAITAPQAGGTPSPVDSANQRSAGGGNSRGRRQRK